ncbi:MAG: alpha/beta hydrolase [Limisphaerales bacterium]
MNPSQSADSHPGAPGGGGWGVWRKIRRVWAALGSVAFVGFTSWCLIAYRATEEGRQALQAGADGVTVTRGEAHWRFTPASGQPNHPVGLVFFAGSLVDPVAYAPLVRAVATNGYPVLLMELPRRGAFGGADGGEVLAQARRAMQQVPTIHKWVIAGHSKGGAVAARFVHESAMDVAGLVLIGTSHPRDFDLSGTAVPVTKVLGTRDGVAEGAKSERNRSKLPPSARWVLIEGGNHSQFGYYGFQPGDWRASISREMQQRRTVAAVVTALDAAFDPGRHLR